MSTQLITWDCVVGLFIIIVFARLYRAAVFCLRNKEKIIDYISEREEFYIPGDPHTLKADEYDFEDIEDL